MLLTRARLLNPRARRPGGSMLRRQSRQSRPSPWDSDEILRDELFSIERLEQHAAQPGRRTADHTTTDTSPAA